MKLLSGTILCLIALFGSAKLALAQGDELASKFAGATLIYHYPSGPYEGFRFSFTFDGTSLRYQALNVDGQPVSPLFPYKAQRIRDGMYLVAWLQPDDTHISLLIDSNGMKVYNSMVWGPEQRPSRPDTWGIHVGQIEEFEFAPQ